MNAKEAKKILPKKEYETFESIFMNQISRTPAATLKQRATLARRLRDKYIDLAHQQIAEIRTRRTNETDTDINDRRVELFQQVIETLETELDRPRNEAAPAVTKKKVSRFQRARNELKQIGKKEILEGRRRERD